MSKVITSVLRSVVSVKGHNLSAEECVVSVKGHNLSAEECGECQRS